MLMALELVEELEGEAAAGSPGRRALPADTEPAPRDEQEFFEAQAAAIREEVRARLVRMVRVPLELRTRRRSEEHTSELQSRGHLVCRLLLEKKKRKSR